MQTKMRQVHRLMFWGGFLSIPVYAVIALHIVFAGPAFDGASTFSAPQIKDLPQFIQRLKNHPDPVSAFLWRSLSNSEQLQLTHYSASTPPSELVPAVVDDLNRAIAATNFFTTERFVDVSYRPVTIKFIASASKGSDIARRNRLLLEDAYPQELSRLSNVENNVAAYASGGFCIIGFLSCCLSQFFTERSIARRIALMAVTGGAYVFLFVLVEAALVFLMHG